MTVPSVSMKSALGIYRSSSLLWLRRRTSCSASVPVTGGSIRVELLHRQLDLVTGIAALLAVDTRERAPFARALGVVAGQPKIWDPWGRASRGALSHRHV